MTVSAADGGAARRLRADAARNRQKLIDAAAEVFAARGLDATLDDIARHAGVNVATAYRHFANKHELAREFLGQVVDRAVAVAEEAAAEPDPWAGLAQFLERSLELITSSRALILEMLSAITGSLGLPHRYIGLILAGLRPGQDRLPGEPPTEELLRQVAAAKG